MLENRCKTIWERMGLTDDQIANGLLRLNPEAINNQELITDKQISNGGQSIKLFWGLESAIANYIDVVNNW